MNSTVWESLLFAVPLAVSFAILCLAIAANAITKEQKNEVQQKFLREYTRPNPRDQK